MCSVCNTLCVVCSTFGCPYSAVNMNKESTLQDRLGSTRNEEGSAAPLAVRVKLESGEIRYTPLAFCPDGITWHAWTLITCATGWSAPETCHVFVRLLAFWGSFQSERFGRNRAFQFNWLGENSRKLSAKFLVVCLILKKHSLIFRCTSVPVTPVLGLCFCHL